ncbi:hypothetical protein AURDEDRAFT_161106 [Auricularia subglabra TFB-10046 SS5]|nr:hypothetical protein AURDEDRAFT_161106 [Auricularia subglabra TFB-10046 SS5]
MGRVERFTSTGPPPVARRTRAWLACLAAALVLCALQTSCIRRTAFSFPSREAQSFHANGKRVQDLFDWDQLKASLEFNWVPCYNGLQFYQVPLDYTVPEGPKASIAVAKWPSKYAANDRLLGHVLARAEILGRLALERVGDSAPYVGTADVARDIVAMNAALGRERIQYWGGSYGTVLGATLAAMYPTKIERMVLDSVLEPETYYRTTWDRNLLTTDAALDYFFTSCAASPSCAFQPPGGGATARELRARFDQIMDGLRRKPVAVVQGDVYGLVDWPLMRLLVFGWLYQPYGTFPLLARVLAGLAHGDGTLAFALGGGDDSTWTCGCAPAPAPPPLAAAEVSAAISCGDGDPVRDSLEELEAWHRSQEAISSFADMNTARVLCSGWKLHAKNRFEGPLAANTSRPILFMGNTADPVTPLSSAHETAKYFPGSVVLGVEGPGHGALLAPSLCSMKHVRTYMREGALPPAGTVCQPDRPIFPTPDSQPVVLSAEDQHLLDSTENLRSAIRLPRLI